MGKVVLETGHVIYFYMYKGLKMFYIRRLGIEDQEV